VQTAIEQPGPVPTGRRIPIWWWFAIVFAVGIAGYSLRYAFLGEVAYTPELSESFKQRPLTVTIHTLFGPFALLGGLVNLLPAMRRPGRWAAHRWVGRLYVVSCMLLGAAGFSMALHATGGLVARVGFLFLAIGTLVTSAQAYLAIRRRAVRQHREWMARSYALIFGAVMLRIWIPLLVMVFQGQFLPAYRLVAWLSWVPNVLFVEWIIRRGWKPKSVLPEGLVG
jgi:uncharacterized membrane protein